MDYIVSGGQSVIGDGVSWGMECDGGQSDGGQWRRKRSGGASGGSAAESELVYLAYCT